MMPSRIFTDINICKPLIFNLTNLVTMDLIANTQLAVGASPIMSNDIREFEELVQIASAVYINIGTLDETFSDKALLLATLCEKYKKKIILDPVGAGATSIRTELAKQLAPYATLIKGNASEILAIADKETQAKGVDSGDSSLSALESAKGLAKTFKQHVVVTGQIDYVTDGEKVYENDSGVKLLQKVVGTGCALGGLLAAAQACNESLAASFDCISGFGLCAEQAFKTSKLSGQFKNALVDELQLSCQQVA